MIFKGNMLKLIQLVLKSILQNLYYFICLPKLK